MIIGDVLFLKPDLDSYLRAQVGAVDEHVRSHVGKADLGKSDADLAAQLLPAALVDPLVVDFDHPQKDVSEVRVRVRDPFMGDVEIDGVRAVRSFGFTGDPGLFQLRTNPFSTVFPYGVVGGGRVTIGIEGRNEPEALKQEIDRQEKLLRDYVGRSLAQVDKHNRSLGALLGEAVSRRRKTLAGLDDLRNKI